MHFFKATREEVQLSTQISQNNGKKKRCNQLNRSIQIDERKRFELTVTNRSRTKSTRFNERWRGISTTFSVNDKMTVCVKGKQTWRGWRGLYRGRSVRLWFFGGFWRIGHQTRIKRAWILCGPWAVIFRSDIGGYYWQHLLLLSAPQAPRDLWPMFFLLPLPLFKCLTSNK